MTSNREDLLQARSTRIKKAVTLARPDRVPVVLEYAGFAAQVTGISLAEYLSSSSRALHTMIQAYRRVGGGDAMNYGSFWPYGLCYDFMCKVRVPGVDLAEHEMWQMDEMELLKIEDYDRILDLGWPEFFEQCMSERILIDVPAERLPPRWEARNVRGAWAEIGVPVLSGGDVTTPMELLCGGRSLIKFYEDLFAIPDKVEAAMKAMVPHLAIKTVRNAIEQGYPAVWVGGWRSAPSMLSPAMWNRFAWPYIRRLVHEVVDTGLIALLHLDSDWTRELERFKELPRGRCVMALDGETNMFKAKEVLGEHMCLMGDLPASLLWQESAQSVYDYSAKLIRELGPEGFILSSGCDIPTNAKLENVQAMVAAATGG